jgi:hypothetical protein
MNVQMFDGRKRARVTQSGNQTILIHGKSGTTEVPIKVDADGNIQISIHDKLDAMITLLTTMSATITSMLGVLEALEGGGT